MRRFSSRVASRAAKKRRGAGSLLRNWTGFMLVAMVAFSFSVSALQNPSQSNRTQTGTRSAGVKPKRSQQPKSKTGKSLNVTRESGASVAEGLSPILAMADFDLTGLAVTAGPASITVPKNTPTVVQTSVQVPEGTDPATIIAGLNPNYRVRGELTGPSLTNPLTLEAPIGQPLKIPPLSNAGDHLVRNLRVIDLGTPDQVVVTSVTPDSCGIVVIERLLISQVSVHELSYDEIVQAGINITDDSYKAFNFVLGVATESNAETIKIPVAFPSVGVSDPRPIVGMPSISGPGIDLPTVVPVMLTMEGIDGQPSSQPPMGGEGPTRIPGVVVFPGRVGFLHQFFEAIVIVGNGAPNGAPLILRTLKATAKLPDNGTPADASDDPLRIAETQTGGRVSELALHGLGPDNKYGTADDTTAFGPAESGQASFLIEGLEEGLHEIDFDLEAILEGLPSGPVKVRGEVSGAVLVRDASFAVTFTHPGVVRAGNQYDLGMTIYNSGPTDIQGAFAQLSRNSVSGAELLGQDTGLRQFATTIKRGESATVKWRLRSNITGEVTATYVKVGEGISAGLALSTGVGDRNIPLSPDSLILPEPVRHLPSSVVEAGRALLGQGWSIANAPSGSLPQGVVKVTKQTVVNRAVELGIAGMRVDFGEPVNVSLDTVLRDWLGELQASPDLGFADAQRNTQAGFDWFDSIGAEFYKSLTGASPVSATDLHQEFANAEVPRSRFISALVTHANGELVVGAQLVDPAGKRVGFGTAENDRAGDFGQGSSLRLMRTDVITNLVTNVGEMLVVSNPNVDNWTLELNGWRDGIVDISLLAPTSTQVYGQYVFSGVQITQGSKFRVRFKPLSLSNAPVLEEFDYGTWHVRNVTPTVTAINQPSPRVVGVIQVTPDVVAGGDKYGRLVGVLFSKPMLQDQAQSVSRYKIGGGVLKNSNPAQQVGDIIGVTGARIDYGNRFVFLSLNSTIGPYIDRDLTISSLQDARRLPLSPTPTTRPIEPRVSPQGIPPGAYLTGRVINADGTPINKAPVIVWVQECPDPMVPLPPPPVPIALRFTDAQGRYEIDYVRDGDCAPMSVTVTNPITHSEKVFTSGVAYDGQHMVLDTVFLARGHVEGNVTSGGQLMANAYVRVVPDLDVVGTKVVQADSNGHYVATDIPVGNVSVLAVGYGDAHNASGFSAGTINGPGQTTFINVSLQNITGIVRGRVYRADQTPSAGALVVAYEVIPGFHSSRPDGATPVGYAFADRDGSFSILNLPVNDVKLEVTDYVTGFIARQSVQLTNAIPEVTGIVINLPGNGAVSGRVTDDIGTPLANIFVSSAGRAVQTDNLGNYTLPSLPAGISSIQAYDPATQRFGSAQAPVSIGQTTTGIDIVILRSSILMGTVYAVRDGSPTPAPAAGIKVTANGYNIYDTNAQGQYTIPNVQPGQVNLRFVDVSKGLAISNRVTLLPGETLTRDATFNPGKIHGKVYQPDGVTPTMAQLSVYVPRPYLYPGPGWGELYTEEPFQLQSAVDGSYSLSTVNPGVYRITTSNVFFPTRVSAGGNLVPGGDEETNLVLVSTLAGTIQGRVFQPDGTTLVGPGIKVTLSGGSLSEVTVRTDDAGHYEFAEVFSAGSYSLTATDPVSGNSNRIGVAVEKNKDAVFDLRLLGSGTLRVQVVDGAGQPVSSGSVNVDGTAYPNTHRYAEITPGNNGLITFTNLPEGSYAVAAARFGLGGRVSAIISDGSTIDVTVQLQATGSVEGHVYMPDGVTPISLADVQLRVGGRSVGYMVSSEEPDIGKFNFINVPTGDFTLDVFDNHTGRVGRSAGTVTEQGHVAVVNVMLLPIGAVRGRVTANGIGVDHAAVNIYADGSGVRGANLFATTDPDGNYRFTGIPAGRFVVSVSDAPGGQTGSASGTITGTNEPLPDQIVNIALEPSLTVTGTVFQHGSTTPVSGAQITITVGGRVFHAATNDVGVYRLGFVPLGEIRVRAEAPVGYDRGEAAPVTGTQPGGTVTANVMLDGVGTISGEALDNVGAPLSAGTVTFTNNAWGTPVILFASVQPGGHYEIPGAPAGHFSLRLTVPGRVGVGSAAGDVLAGQTTNVPLQLEDAGTVIGIVKTADGATPVQGASVAVILRRTGSSLSFYTHTNAQGLWTLTNVPLGTLDISILDEVSGGIARATDVALATNGQIVDIGALLLDSTKITVVSVNPANTATGVPTNGTVVTVTFSESAESYSVNSSTVQLLLGSSGISSTVSLSSDGLTATLTPTSRLAETALYRVSVQQIEDRAGLRLANTFNSTFTTADETAPAVTAISPANGAVEVAPEGNIQVTFSEVIDPAQNFANVINVASFDAPQIPLAGNYELDGAARVATFTPTGGFNESTRYTVTVNGQRDLSGNIQAQSFVSTFGTQDRLAPVIDPLPIDGTTVNSAKPTITATYHDNFSGIKTSSVVLTVDNINVTSSALVTVGEVTYTPAVPLALGQHTVTVEVADNAGNGSGPRTASFTFADNTPPTVTAIAPPNGATEVPPDANVVVTFSEPIDGANLAEVISVVASQTPETLLVGSYELDAGGSVATFRPAGGFSDSTQYRVNVSGARDLSGNVQTQAAGGIFTIQDRTAPVIDPLPLDGTTVHPFKPTITATYHDNLSGIKMSSVVLTVDSVNVTPNATVTGSQVTYTPAAPLAIGPHTVSVEVSDNAGNAAAARTATFTIEDAGITINSFTINGQAAVDGMTVFNEPRPIFSAVFTDESGIDTSQTRLLFSRQGETLQAVSATVTESGLTYQPAQELTAGAYTVQLIVVDLLGQTSTSGVIGFTLNLQGPEILSIFVATGSTHGGDVVTITGNYLVDSPVSPDVNARGLSAAYYQDAPCDYGSCDQYGVGLRATRTDAAIDFEWHEDTPSLYIDPWAFTVKWRGQIQPLYSETYTFHVDTDSAMDLWINDQRIEPHRIEDQDIGAQASIDLVAGQRYDLRVDYKSTTLFFGQRTNRKARLLWSSTSQPQQAVPTAQLYPAAQPSFPVVMVGGQQATVLGAVAGSPNQLSCIIPPHPHGTANVEVQNARGTALLENGFTYATDEQPARAIAFSVPRGAKEVASSTPLRITFSEPLDPAQDFTYAMRLYSQFLGQVIPGTVTLDETGRVATLTLAAPLPDDDTYTLDTNGARDLAGNYGYYADTNFSTVDRSGPRIDYVYPENNMEVDNASTEIGANYYDTASGVDPNSAELIVDGVDVSALSTRDAHVLHYYPATPLALGQHTASVRVKDLSGRWSDTTTFSFTVIPPIVHAPEIQQFTIAGRDAVDGLVFDDRFPQIFVRFADNYAAIDVPATKLFFGPQNSTLTQVPINVNFWWQGYYYFTYNQPQALDYGHYSVRFEATNTLGNTTTRTVNFEVAFVDVYPPQLIDTFPANAATQVPTDTQVRLTFDEDLDPAQDFASQFLMVDANDPEQLPIAGSFSLDNTQRIVTFTPAAPLHESTSYYVQMFGVRDVAGNANNWGIYTYFATVDHVPPIIESVQIGGQPADGVHVTLRQPTIYAFYSDSVSGIDSSTAAFTIDGVSVSEGVTQEWYFASYMPPAPLAPGPHTITFRVADLAGNLSEIVSATFVVDDAISITRVEPAQGFTQGGKPLAIFGSGLINTDGTLPIVKLGNTQVSVDEYYHYVVDEFGSQIYFNQAPPGQAGAVDVIVETDHGTATLVNGYTYDDGVSISAVTPNHGFTVGGESLTITGAGMINFDGSRPTVRFGGTLVEDYFVNESGSIIEINRMPAAPAGTVDVIVETNHGTATLTGGYTYEIDPTTPFAVEADTLLLWHLDTFPGGECRRAADSGPRHLDSENCASFGGLVPGRFSQGLRNARLPVQTDGGTFAFGAAPFTLEAWVKLNTTQFFEPVNVFWRADSQGLSKDYALMVLPSGEVRTEVTNAVGDIWQATMPAATLSIGDNKWHSLAMVVERGTDPLQDRLIIYVDGEERASAAAPANFGAIRDGGGKFRASSSSSGFVVLDEVRVSNTAHSADLIRRTYRGVDLGFVVLRTLPAVVARGETTEVTIEGYNLDNVAATLTGVDGSPLAATITPIDRQHTIARFGISVDQATPLGPAILNLTSGTQTVPQPVRIVEQHPFSVDAGTVLLWRLDGPNFANVTDASPSGITGFSGIANPGRFAEGKTNANAFSASPALSFAGQPFSASCWIKTTGSLSDFDLFRLPSGNANSFSVRLLHSKVVSAAVRSVQGAVWQAATPEIYLGDNQWHLITMVVERGSQPEQNNLRIYVDGTERISTQAPAGFGALPNANGQFAVGPLVFGALDEVRLLNYAQTSAQAAEDWFGPGQSGAANAPLQSQQKAQSTTAAHPGVPVQPPLPAIQILSLTSGEVARDRIGSKPVVTALTITGDRLDGVGGVFMRDGKTLDGVSVKVQDSSVRLAHLEVSVAPAVPLGPAQLVLSPRGNRKGAAAIDIQITEHSEFAIEADTVGLWHLDEREEGAARLLDASDHAISLATGQTSRVTEGRFGGGRSLARANAETSSDALNFGAASFTVEGWIKTDALDRDYVLVGKETNTGQNTDFSLKALSSGALRAEIYDTNGVAWQAESVASVADGKWHSIALVADRETGSLSLYIDAQLRAATLLPAGFAGVRNLGQPLNFGAADTDGPSGAGREEFPGALDEIRISSTAHRPEKIAADFFGHDEPQITLVRPAYVRKGSGPADVTLSGYALTGAVVTTTQPGVTATVVSTSWTSLKLSVVLADSVPAEPIVFTITDALGRAATVELKVAERLTGSRLGSPAVPVFGRRASERLSPNRGKLRSGAFLRSPEAARDAKPLGGQR